MTKTDRDLIHWVNSGKSKRATVTLGQLILLLEMAGSASVAAISGGETANAVNYRQKLARLDLALGVGTLTRLVGNATQVTETGRRIAGEVRLLLAEMQNATTAEKNTPTWVFGAGEAWLQSVIVPALGEIATSHPDWKWEVRNLTARQICEGVREGTIHFGFVRHKDIKAVDRLEESRTYELSGYAVVAGNIAGPPRAAKDLIAWLVAHQRPLIQQGSSWLPLRAVAVRELGIEKLLGAVEPRIRCETHPQAIAAAERGQSWCIVPANMVRAARPSMVASAIIDAAKGEADMTLITYPRKLAQIPTADNVVEVLKTEIGKALRTGK